jgi:hypothetical protein
MDQYSKLGASAGRIARTGDEKIVAADSIPKSVHDAVWPSTQNGGDYVRVYVKHGTLV